MNVREREQYLREYSILKGQGKPFFPYAIAKDGAMAAITLGVIITMAILFGAELGPKADPTTTTYTPRTEWYFFFLFELLRVVKPPALVFLAISTELTATLMLSPIGTRTLATEFWSASSELRYGAAAPYALLLVLVSVPATVLLMRSDDPERVPA